MHHSLGRQSYLVHTLLMCPQLTLGVEHNITFTAPELAKAMIAPPVGLKTLLGVELVWLLRTLLT